MATTQARVMIIAGSDSGGGAGIQGDIKTVTCLGGYAATAITALTAQNTLGVHGIHPVPPAFIQRQIEAVLNDIGADIIKTGMLLNNEVIHILATTLTHYDIPLIIDPVMVAKGGAALLSEDAIEDSKSALFPQALLITPNIPEAELLTHTTITDETSMHHAATQLLAMGPQAVLIKGGHLTGETLIDLLITKDSTYRYVTTRIDTPHTHGTGCCLASAIATYYAQGHNLSDAIEKAHAFIQKAIANAPGLGKGKGPLGITPEFSDSK